MYENWQILCGYELPTNLQNFTQKHLTEVKIFQKVIGGLLFSETPCTCFSLHKLLDICSNYAVTWDTLFTPVKTTLSLSVKVILKLFFI